MSRRTNRPRRLLFAARHPMSRSYLKINAITVTKWAAGRAMLSIVFGRKAGRATELIAAQGVGQMLAFKPSAALSSGANDAVRYSRISTG